MVLDRELAGRRGREADVDHIAADRLQRREDDSMKERSRHATVAPTTTICRVPRARRPRAECQPHS